MSIFLLVISGLGFISSTQKVAQGIQSRIGLENRSFNQWVVTIAASLFVFCFAKLSLSTIAPFFKQAFSLKCNKILNDCFPFPFLVEELFSQVIDRNQIDPLHCAIEANDVDSVRRLIQSGADVNALDDKGFSPLFKVVQTGHLEIAHALIQGGANLNPFNLSAQKPYSLLAHAACAGHLDIIELFMQNGANEASLSEALDEAIKIGNRAVVRSIVEWRAHKGEVKWKRIDAPWCPLATAVHAQQLHIAQYLIDQGAVVNPKEPCQILRQPLLHTAIQRENYDLVKCLIKNGANVNQPYHWGCHEKGNTSTLPLEEAVKKKRVDIAQLLIDHGAQFTDSVGKLLQKNRLKNVKRLMREWKFLYALGITEEKIVELLPQHPPALEEEKQMTVAIEGKAAEYPVSFLTQIPYFNALINGPWSQNRKESNRLDLNEAPSFQDQSGDDFICNHEILRALQNKLSNPNALWEEDLTAFSSLGVGIPALLDYPRQLNALKTILNMQAQLLKNPTVQWEKFVGISSPKPLSPKDAVGGILEGPDSLWVKWDVKDLSHGIETAINQTAETLNRCIQDTAGWNTVFDCNRLIFNLVKFLESQALAIFLKEKKACNHLIGALLVVLEKCPKLSEFLTILELPPSATFQEPGFADVLRSLPNLLYLRITIGKGERIKIEDSRLHEEGYAIQLRSETPHYDLLIKEKALDKDIASQHGALRLLEIVGQAFTPGQKETLQHLFPNADLLDIQMVELQNGSDKLKIGMLNPPFPFTDE